MGRLLSLLVAVCIASAQAVRAESFPSKTVTLVVPFAAGSGTDTVARLLGHHLTAALGQTVIGENKAGANGVIPASYVSRWAPDGHTLLVAPSRVCPSGAERDIRRGDDAVGAGLVLDNDGLPQG